MLFKKNNREQTELALIKKKFARRLKRFTELKILGLKPLQVYPPTLLKSPEYLLGDEKPLIKMSTPVGSMGSCFAREIKNYLEKKGFNYVNKGEGKNSDHGSAPWDRVFNTACILQEIERAFGNFNPDYLELNDGSIVDPYRKGVIYQTREEAVEESENYIKAASSALIESRVFIITLGLSEVWFEKYTNRVFAEPPPFDLYDKERHGFKLLSPSENSANLCNAIELLKSKNPEINIIITVSPIPLRATFFNRSAIISNNISKSSLVFSAHEVIERYEFVHYFPAYEITHNLIDDPFEWDCRHVKRTTIEQIMSMFEAVYLYSK